MKIILVLACLISTQVLADKVTLPKEVPFKLSNLEQAQASRDTQKTPSASTYAHRISGQIAAASKSSISFRVPSGFISKILAKPGDIVKKGDVLASLDPIDFELQLNLAKVGKNQAVLQETIARNEYNREKQLKSDGASTGSQLEQAEFKFKQAQISVQQADINLKTAERNLEHTKLRAPYNCIVAVQHKDQAERVGMEVPVYEVYEVNSTEVNLNVPEILVGKVQIGTKLMVSVPSVNYREEAIVTKVVPIVLEASRTFKVTAVLKNNEAKVVPGLFAEAQLN
jgi:RND family efflux transporter MFP subunit